MQPNIKSNRMQRTLLAKTGLLKNRKATTNKMAFDWVANLDQEVQLEAAGRISTGIEYIWNKDRNDDPFC